MHLPIVGRSKLSNAVRALMQDANNDTMLLLMMETFSSNMGRLAVEGLDRSVPLERKFSHRSITPPLLVIATIYPAFPTVLRFVLTALSSFNCFVRPIVTLHFILQRD